MSAGNPTGAVNIPIGADLSGAYAAMERFRADAARGISIPVGPGSAANYSGPGSPANYSGPGGPATFGNPGGAPAIMPNLAAMLAAAGGTGPNAAAGPTGGQQLSNAVSQLTAAAQQIAGAVHQMSRTRSVGASQVSSPAVVEEYDLLHNRPSSFSGRLGPGIGRDSPYAYGSDAAPASGSSVTDLRARRIRDRQSFESPVPDYPYLNGPESDSRSPARSRSGFLRFGLSTNGLARYVSAGFVAREAMSVGQTYRDYGVAQSLANGQPEGSFRAEEALISRVSGIPIVGQAADLLTDPTGSARAYRQRTIEEAGLQDAIGEDRFRSAAYTRQIGRDIYTLHGVGTERERRSVESQRQSSLEDLTAERSRRASKVVQYYESMRQPLREQAGASSAGYSPENAAKFERANASAIKSLNSVDALQKSQLDSIDQQIAKQRDLVNRQAGLRLEDITRGQNVQNILGMGSTQAAILRATGNPLAASMAEAGSNYRAGVISNPSNAGALMAMFAGNTLALGVGVARDFAANYGPGSSQLAYQQQAQQARFDRNPIAAQRAEIEGRSAEAVRRVRENVPDIFGLQDYAVGKTREYYKREGDLGEKEIKDRTRGVEAGIRARNESLEISTGRRDNPAMGSAIAQINNIGRAAELAAYSTSIDPNIADGRRQAIIRQQLRGGELQLQQFQQEFNRSVSTVDVSNLAGTATSGPGTGNPAEIKAAIDKQTAELKAALLDVSGKIEALIEGGD